jgi:hypothetical protein
VIVNTRPCDVGNGVWRKVRKGGGIVLSAK